MNRRIHSIVCGERKNITIAFGVMVMFILLSSCGDGHKKLAPAIEERDSLPVLDTKGITSLVSDSGVVQYRINTPEWLVFDRKDPAYWAFEKGVYLEKFDSLMHTEASIKADTAYYYNNKGLWELKGKVDIQNMKGERFNTNLLYWDENSHKVYSDAKIKIQQPDKTIYGHGFDSDDRMQKWEIRKVEGVIYVDDMAQNNDSIKNDSVRVDSIK